MNVAVGGKFGPETAAAAAVVAVVDNCELALDVVFSNSLAKVETSSIAADWSGARRVDLGRSWPGIAAVEDAVEPGNFGLHVPAAE